MREDPFAIQLLVQSVDRMLLDVAKNEGKKLPFNWDDYIKPEYKTLIIRSIRETSNFVKHADRDHNDTLRVDDIANLNFLELAMCIVNYRDLYGEWTSHMQLLFNLTKVVAPDALVHPEQRGDFDAVIPKLQDMKLGDYLTGWWDDQLLQRVLPNLAIEKFDDLQDTSPLYDTRIRDLTKK